MPQQGARTGGSGDQPAPGLPKWTQKSCKIDENPARLGYRKLALNLNRFSTDFRNDETLKTLKNKLFFNVFAILKTSRKVQKSIKK